MPQRLLIVPAINFVESFIDNVVREKVKPKKGSIVYCDLAFGYAEHSGIYIGDNKIVQLNGNGKIEAVSPKSFINRLDGFSTAISIYVSCNDTNPVGNKKVAKRAEEMIGKTVDYHLFENNCHQFSAGCLTGDFNNSSNYLTLLKDKCKAELKANNWLVWDIDLFVD